APERQAAPAPPSSQTTTSTTEPTVTGAPGPNPATRKLFTRTANGVTARGEVLSFDPCRPATIGDVGNPSPLKGCPGLPQTLSLQATLTNEFAVGRAYLAPEARPVPSDVVPALDVGLFGTEEQAQSSWVALRVASDVVLVRATFADGAVDEMAPVEGWALLLRAGTATGGTAQAFASDGH